MVVRDPSQLVIDMPSKYSAVDGACHVGELLDCCSIACSSEHTAPTMDCTASTCSISVDMEDKVYITCWVSEGERNNIYTFLACSSTENLIKGGDTVTCVGHCQPDIIPG